MRIKRKGSIGEQVISKILEQEGFEFIREYSPKDLKKKKLRFDFYLPKEKILLEYNGEQHYKFINYFYKNKKDFLKAQERDRMKMSFALSHNLKLYCIPFWEINTIENSNDFLIKENLVTSKFHNDEKWRWYQNHRSLF